MNLLSEQAMTVTTEEDQMGQTIADADALTADITPPELAGFTTLYGVPVREIRDDDGEWVDALVALGHPEPLRVLAAFNAHARNRNWLLGDELAGPLTALLDRRWAVIDPIAGEVPIYDRLTVQPIRWEGVDPLTPGSFPVTVLQPGPRIPDPAHEQEIPS
jgi:hypothetical protein